MRDDVIVLCHGGPIAEPADAEYVLRRAEVIHGFYGASSMERLPVEQALKPQTEAVQGGDVRMTPVATRERCSRPSPYGNRSICTSAA